MRRRAALLVILLLLFGMTSGCWDMRELNHLALVMAVGIDKAEEPGRYLVTVQVARPISGGKGKGGGTGGAGGESPVYTASADGDTLLAAIRNLAQFTSRRLMWAHNNVVVIGEEVARDDITPVMDFFTRNQELRMRTWVVVVRGKARPIVAAKTGMESIPADSISALFRYALLPGESVVTDVNEVTAAFFAPDLNMVISAMQLTERVVPTDSQSEHGGVEQVELRGSALFRDKRLVGFIEKDAGRGLLWLRGEMRNSVLTVPCPNQSEKNMAIEVRAPQVRIRSEVSGKLPRFRVSVTTSGWLLEMDCVTSGMDLFQLRDYAERVFAEKVKSTIHQALEVLQTEARTDAIRFGRHLHVHHREWWRRHADRWPQIFPEVKVEVTVAARIPKMGLYTRPMNRDFDFEEQGGTRE